MKHSLSSLLAALTSVTLALPLVAPLGARHHQAATLAAGAPDGVLTPAPVPGLPPDGPSPADRAAQPGSSLAAGPVASTPFSAAPDSLLSGGGTQGPQASPLRTPEDAPGLVTPNLSK